MISKLKLLHFWLAQNVRFNNLDINGVVSKIIFETDINASKIIKTLKLNKMPQCTGYSIRFNKEKPSVKFNPKIFGKTSTLFTGNSHYRKSKEIIVNTYGDSPLFLLSVANITSGKVIKDISMDEYDFTNFIYQCLGDENATILNA